MIGRGFFFAAPIPEISKRIQPDIMYSEIRKSVLELDRLVATGRRSDAAALLRSLASDPEISDQHRMRVANTALYIGECSVAETLARAHANAEGQNPLRAVSAGGILAQAGRFEEALSVVESQLDEFGDNVSVNHFLGTVYQQLGNRTSAERHLLTVLDAYELAGITWLTLAAQHDFGRDDALFRQMLHLREKFASCDPGHRVPYQFALGKALLDVGEVEVAIDVFSKGASLVRESSSYDPERDLGEATRIVSYNAREDLNKVAVKRDSRADVIFLVGMPRSGTTLLQRLLMASDVVVDGGEFSGMGVATMDFRRRGLDTARAFSKLEDAGAGAMDEIAALYSYLLRERFGDRATVVDKSIRNTQFVGLFAMAFPNSPIVLIERDPLDIAWSCFRACFNAGQPWSWKRAHIANHIRAEARLIEHWKNVLPERIVSVRYEDIVRAPLQTLPKVFESLGIEFDEKILEFHEQQNGAVTTASVGQVSKPLYTDSIGIPKVVLDKLGPEIAQLRELQIAS